MNRLKYIRESCGVTQSDFAKKMNVAPSSVSCWENGVNEMDYDTIIKAADYFNTTIDYILGHDSLPDKLSQKEKMLISCYRDLPEAGQAFLFDIAIRMKNVF